MNIDSNLNFVTTSQNIKDDFLPASLLKDDPWALLRQCLGATEEIVSFERDQPLLAELPERDDI